MQFQSISTKWVKRAKGDGVKCRVCVRGYDQEVDPGDTYASTLSLTTLKLLLTLAVAHGWHILAGDISTAFLHALLADEVFVIPPVEYYPKWWSSLETSQSHVPKGSNLALLLLKVISESAFNIKSAFDSKSDIGKRF